MRAITKQIGTILLVSAVLAGVVNLVHPRQIPWIQDWSHQVEEQALQNGMKVIPVAMAVDLFEMQAVLFVDARAPGEFNEGHIPGALNVPLQAWEDHLMMLFDYIEADTQLVVYCSNRTCDDALLLATELKKIGSDVSLFIGGFDGWKKHGGEVEP